MTMYFVADLPPLRFSPRASRVPSSRVARNSELRRTIAAVSQDAGAAVSGQPNVFNRETRRAAVQDVEMDCSELGELWQNGKNA